MPNKKNSRCDVLGHPPRFNSPGSVGAEYLLAKKVLVISGFPGYFAHKTG
jgi:hypothetical protein